MLQLFRLQNAERIKVVYGKIISRDNTLVYYDSEKNLVKLSKELEIENTVRTVGFKLPRYLNNVPFIGEKATVFEKNGVNSTYKRTIETKESHRGIELVIETIEKIKNQDKPLERKIILVGDYFDYALLNL